MASTAIPDVKEAIITTLGEAESLKGITVTDDKEPETQSEYIWIMKTSSKRDFKTLGPGARLDEVVRIVFLVAAIKGNAKANPSEERALEIFEAMETALRADDTLNNTVFFHKIEELEINPVVFDQKRGCYVTAVLTAKTRI